MVTRMTNDAMTNDQQTVGILAFQGDVREHEEILSQLGVKSVQIRTTDDLKKVGRLIIPGGESTVMARFLKISGLDAEIIKRAKKGMPVFGTCAGAILIASKVKGRNSPQPLGLIQIEVDRNAYGSQVDSFDADLKVKGCAKKVPVSFIRAPKISSIGKEVKILASVRAEPVLVIFGKTMAATFHPEMRGATAIHKLFLSL